MHAGDERRLTGYAALPFNLNPYLRTFGEPVLAAGTILPAAGAYDVVFDSPSAATRRQVLVPLLAERLDAAYRRPPKTKRVQRGTPLGWRSPIVGPASTRRRSSSRSTATSVAASLAGSTVRVPTAALAKGRHTLRLQVSDYQETRNMENVGPILPNTRILQTTFVVT